MFALIAPPAPPTPLPVTITGVRIPADGTPAHLVQLETMSAADARDGFLFHVPDLRQYWTKLAWDERDLCRLDLQQDVYANCTPLSHHLQQKDHLKELLYSRGHIDRQRHYHLSQRYLLHQRYHFLPQPFYSCTGTYYVMFCFLSNELPLNPFVPTWIKELENGCCLLYYGDVFVVKMAPQEHGKHDWASYADITPQFLDLLMKGPLERG
jgi:hypothetical protein